MAVLPGIRSGAGTDDILLFSLTWNGGTAALDHLVYNGLLVEETPAYGGGRLSVKFTRPREAAHLFEWSLLFPGRTMQTLEAKATVDGGSASTLASASSADSRWAASGSC